jgi:hypothetical protein
VGGRGVSAAAAGVSGGGAAPVAAASAASPPPAVAAASPSESALTPPEALKSVLVGRDVTPADADAAENGGRRSDKAVGLPSAAAKLAAAAAATAEAALTSRLAGMHLVCTVGTPGGPEVVGGGAAGGKGGGDGVARDLMDAPTAQRGLLPFDNGIDMQVASTPKGSPPGSPLTWWVSQPRRHDACPCCFGAARPWRGTCAAHVRAAASILTACVYVR